MPTTAPIRITITQATPPTTHLRVSINGGVYTQGRHTRGKGQEGDMEKLNEATILGWRVLQFSTGQVQRGIALDTIERLFKS